jgi:hypothetical protein
MTELLNSIEQQQLLELEAVIEQGMRTFVEVGGALYTIRDQRLYRAQFDTFDAYCQTRWGFSDSRARQLIGAAQTVTTVTVAGLPEPTTERQARELKRLPADVQVEVWRETVERTNGQPSSTAVRETYAAMRRDDELIDRSSLGAPHVRAVIEHGLNTPAPDEWSPMGNTDRPKTIGPPLTNRRGRQMPQRAQRKAISDGLSALSGLCAGFARLDGLDESINAEEAERWLLDLSESLRVLRTLNKKIKEHIHGTH